MGWTDPGGFTGWKDHNAYRKSLDRSIRDLTVDTHSRSEPP
jgi:hypothetical protein